MHYIGYIIYALVIASFFLVEAVYDLVAVSFDLATEITVACIVIAFYPPLNFFYFQVRGLSDKISYERYCSVATTSGNTVVSLGLIGTFIGLTQMIEKIAGAIGQEGGSIDEQIALIMTAIGESLSAMSFAFLTSIMGVAASIMIFCATIYFKTFFDKVGEHDELNYSNEAMEARIANIEEDSNKLRKFVNRVINSNIDRKELASIVISNTLQVKALTESSGKLSTSVTSQAEINTALITAINELNLSVQDIKKNQLSILKYSAGNFEKVSLISDGQIKKQEKNKNVAKLMAEAAALL